ncbi:MAG: hypothetical protein AB8F74_00745 [Saprospiraceae bacterium]
MNLQLLIVLLLFLLQVNLTAQDYTVQWGEGFKINGSGVHTVGVGEDQYYISEYGKKSRRLLTYDFQHKLRSKKSSSFTNTDVLRTRNGIFGISSTTLDPTSKDCKLFVTKLFKGTFPRVKTILKHDFDRKKKSNFFMKEYYWDLMPDFSFNLNQLSMSPDSSHVAFVNLIKLMDKSNPQQLMLALFDADMNKLWSKVQKFNYPNDEIAIIKAAPGNNGTLYLLAKRENKSAPSKKMKFIERGDFIVFQITENEIKEFPIEINKELHPTKSTIHALGGPEGGFAVTGFYTDQKPKTKHLGTFCIVGKSDGTITSVKSNPFEESFWNSLSIEKPKKGVRDLGKHFYIYEAFTLPNGSFGFISQNDHSTPGPQGRVFRHTHELVVAVFSKSGSLLGVHGIDKKFRISDVLPPSYSYGIANNKIYLLYNDSKTKSGKKGGKGIFTDLSVINEKGAVEFQETIFNSNETRYFFAPSLCAVSEDGILVGTYRPGKKCRYGWISLNQQ